MPTTGHDRHGSASADAGPSGGTSRWRRLAGTFAGSPDSPVSWRNSLSVFLTLVLSAGLGALLDARLGGQTVGASALMGMFLGVIAAVGPLFMAVRLVALIGVLMSGSVALAAAAQERPWLAVLGMVVVAFGCTLLTVLPLIGVLVGTFPAIVYLVVFAQNDTMTGGAGPGRAMLAVLAPMLAAILVALLLSGRDPRRTVRGAVAGSWAPEATWPQQGNTLALLRLDFAPPTLIAVTHDAIAAMICRNWLAAERTDPAYAQGIAADAAVAATLGPAGRVTPRTVSPPLAPAVARLTAAGSAASDHRTAFAWRHWGHVLTAAGDHLAGTRAPDPEVVSRGSLVRTVVRSVVHPESAPFRYAVQRALALGVGTVVMVTTSLPEFYWALLAMFSVLQASAGATAGRAVQYAFGTWVGAVGAVLLGLVVPAPVVALVAFGLLLVGFAYMVRNYFVFSIAIAAAMVLLVGSPDGQYLQWAGLRALDVTVGAVVAVAVATLVLRVRPQPDRHVGQAKAALLSAIARLKAAGDTAPADRTALLADERRFFRAVANLQSDTALLPDDDALAQTRDRLVDANDHVLALSAVLLDDGRPDPDTLSGPEGRHLVDQALDRLHDQVTGLDAGGAGDPAAPRSLS